MKSALILSAALLSTTALAGTAQAQDVQIENAVARVIVLVEDRAVAAYFEAAAQIDGADPKQVGNWVPGEVIKPYNCSLAL